jgi:hypothetical protein
MADFGIGLIVGIAFFACPSIKNNNTCMHLLLVTLKNLFPTFYLCHVGQFLYVDFFEPN